MPAGEPANQSSCLVSAEVPTQWGVMTLLENTLQQTSPVWYAVPISLALPPAVEQATANDEGSSCWPVG